MTSCFNKIVCCVLALLLCACVAAREGAKEGTIAAAPGMTAAALPIENLSGAAAPLADIRRELIAQAKAAGLAVLDDRRLDAFMARSRLRYTGGLSPDTARAFAKEEGVQAVLVTSLELHDETIPPKLSFTTRVVSTGDLPEILWIESVGLAGDDTPGLLSLGLIEDPRALRDKAMDMIGSSLAFRLAQERDGGGRRSAKEYAPKVAYRSSLLDPGGQYTVMVVPFVNVSERRNAGEIVSLLFVERLAKAGNVKVVEPGVVRQALLNLRIIMEEGLSLADADALFSVVDADLIVTGKVFSYLDYRGATGTPKVDFATIAIEKKSREVVWSSDSYRQGNEGVFLFDFGQVNNAHAMAYGMVGAIVRQMVGG